ncbi:hypothetical protein JL475_09820 [Streptomyces sp. M2CJ-2]|uniref:hypothetical protein n=1 Tax=Streptomyces sp. M2CJ-2 TaxID=2803948 RepID=UPI001920743E|nr:hypothetical protein [Streptomyces sp. M2CJ-2]MBL3666285.1 hypothetical protein [Streptomyces sp. M2CJ-2]
MRRTVRALSLAAVSGTVLGALAPAVFADPSADPFAEVSPGRPAPGGTVTVSVLCDPAGDRPPETLEATSEAFDKGVVELKKVTGSDDKESGPAYRGTANIRGAGGAGGPGGDPVDEADPSDEPVPLEETDSPGEADPSEEVDPSEKADPLYDIDPLSAVDGPDPAGEDSARTVEGTCPAAPGKKGKPWSAAFTVARHSGGSDAPSPSPSPFPSTSSSTSHCPERERAQCGSTAVPGGVHAGTGGGFNDSVPALAAGGLLIAGAFGAAAHRLYRDRTARTGR